MARFRRERSSMGMSTFTTQLLKINYVNIIIVTLSNIIINKLQKLQDALGETGETWLARPANCKKKHILQLWDVILKHHPKHHPE